LVERRGGPALPQREILEPTKPTTNPPQGKLNKWIWNGEEKKGQPKKHQKTAQKQPEKQQKRRGEEHLLVLNQRQPNRNRRWTKSGLRAEATIKPGVGGAGKSPEKKA